jgi:hypothetical protein
MLAVGSSNDVSGTVGSVSSLLEITAFAVKEVVSMTRLNNRVREKKNTLFMV